MAYLQMNAPHGPLEWLMGTKHGLISSETGGEFYWTEDFHFHSNRATDDGAEMDFGNIVTDELHCIGHPLSVSWYRTVAPPVLAAVAVSWCSVQASVITWKSTGRRSNRHTSLLRHGSFLVVHASAFTLKLTRTLPFTVEKRQVVW